MIYLICFDRPYRHAHHYIGSTNNLPERIHEHEHGRGARLMAVSTEAGIRWQVAATFEGGRKGERSSRNRKNAAQLCPNCRAKFQERQRTQSENREPGEEPNERWAVEMSALVKEHETALIPGNSRPRSRASETTGSRRIFSTIPN